MVELLGAMSIRAIADAMAKTKNKNERLFHTSIHKFYILENLDLE